MPLEGMQARYEIDHDISIDPSDDADSRTVHSQYSCGAVTVRITTKLVSAPEITSYGSKILD